MEQVDAGPNLPQPVQRALRLFLDAAQAALGPRLQSAVLYGSAAEGRLRPTSDVNLLLVLGGLDREALDGMADALRVAHASVGLDVMFLLEHELPAAAQAFAAKFADIRRRRRVLLGPDPFHDLAIPRAALVARLRQILLNLVLRLRRAYALHGLREDELARLVADEAGPLRTGAAALLELEGSRATSAKQALAQVAATLADDGFRDPLARLSEAREKGLLAPGVAGPTLFRLMELAQGMRARAESLS
jgi:predicted nucleotidyltransferase